MKSNNLEKYFNFLFLHRKWLWWIGAFILLYSFVAGDTGFYNQIRLVREGKKLEKEIALAKTQKEDLKKEVDSLKHNKDRLRLEAYKLGMGAKDETMILVDEGE